MESCMIGNEVDGKASFRRSLVINHSLLFTTMFCINNIIDVAHDQSINVMKQGKRAVSPDMLLVVLCCSEFCAPSVVARRVSRRKSLPRRILRGFGTRQNPLTHKTQKAKERKNT